MLFRSIGLLGGGLGAYAETQEDDIPGKESKKCPAGYVYNPATRACQPEGDTAKKVAALRSVKNKEGKSMFDETVRKLVTKPKDPAGGGGGGGRSQVDVNVKVDAEGRVKGTEVRTQDSKNTALAVGNVAAG